ncbi:hypothetical protein SLEP1_g35645 [Rubroshorea leprosula]|uniref:Reverse transcriptase domain-containing protein n=1 Tax=Rubroshorea leprosula TaxID=152421 RepID=A0AAV5KNY6_9ROSI|nr:hypothetical protein SLEP1_g35645 [Rubroshorea leprosula]
MYTDLAMLLLEPSCGMISLAKSRIEIVFSTLGVISTVLEEGMKEKLAMTRGISDHCPISLSSSNFDWGPKPFRSIDSWTSHPGFSQMIEKSWNSFYVKGFWGFKCKEKLKLLRQKLKQWNKEEFGNIDSQLEEAMKKVDFVDFKCENQDLTEDDMLKRKEGFVDLWQCLRKKESLWRQKSRATWGTWIDDPAQVKKIVMDHFSSQFSSQPQLRPSLQHLQFNKLSDMDRGMLEAEFTIEEIREVVSSCASDKALGPDGFNFHFIKSIWETIEGDIINFLNEFHQNGRLVCGLNVSYITLVPKKKNPTTLQEYRPITMVGCLYKILAKILSNRLKKVIGKIINSSQSAFLEGRQLVDGVLALNELVHYLKMKKKKGLLFKADFEKAFDSVNWNYLDSMHFNMGFGDKWRSWMKECLSSASFSILVNGSPTPEFKMQRGLRQGDPLSPYLFLIVAEGLHALLYEAERKNLLEGVDINENLSISHLQFADDTVLIRDASLKSIRAFKFLLRWFEIVSGLKINFGKSILYGINTEERWLSMATSTLNSKHGNMPFIYLGLPIGDDPHKISFWNPVVEKFQSKLAAWKGRLLSFRGHVTLLTSVLSALPLFYFSLCKVLKGVLADLVKIQKNFLWGGSDSCNNIAWVNWGRVCLNKSKGGLSIPNLALRNSTLLGKWWCKFYDDDENGKLWEKIIVSKYYEGAPIDSITNIVHSILSPLWKDILSIGRDDERASACFIDGDGSKTRFWKDVWQGNSPLMADFPRLFNLTRSKNLLVADLKQPNTDGWAFQWRMPPFGRELDELRVLENILKKVFIPYDRADQVTWKHNLVGYSTKHAYRFLEISSSCLDKSYCKIIWSPFTPSKVSIFAWRLFLNRLPTKDNLIIHGVDLASNSNCVLCGDYIEDLNHIFATCCCSQNVWKWVCCWWGVPFIPIANAPLLIIELCSLMDARKSWNCWALSILTTAWTIWYFINGIVFNKLNWEENNIYGLIQAKTFCWIKGKSKSAVFSFGDWC